MKTVSVFDLQRIEELSHLTIFDIIDVKNDDLVYPYLAILGIDIEYPVMYQVAYHRTLANECKVGYLLAGEIQCNREFANSPWCTAQDRMIIAGVTDFSLAKELMEMSNTQISYDTIHSSDENQNREIQNILDHYVDPAETERIEREMKQLEELLFIARGSQLLKSGAYKTKEQYQQEEAYEKPRKKKVKKVKEI